MQKKYLILTMLLFLFLQESIESSFALDAQVVVLNPEADAYVRDGAYANDNYGTETSLKTKSSSADYTRESFIRFDLSSVSFNVKHAALRLFATGVGLAGSTDAVALVSANSWGETTITWNNKPSSSVSIVSWNPVVGEVSEIDVTTQVQQAMLGDKKLSLRIYALTWDVNNNYDSKESSSPPGLVIMDNLPPTAAFTTNPTSGDTAPLKVSFDASGSSDSGGTVATYSWDFGDGQSGSGVTTTHTYTTSETYTITLNVTDNQGATDIEKATIIVGSEIGINPNTLKFYAVKGSTNLENQQFNITNTKLGTLSWSVSDDVKWLSLSPSSGSTTTEKDKVTTSVDISGLSEGTYNATITITDPDAANSPQTIDVMLNVIFPAFPGAEGFGAGSVGGRGGTVIEVTNLNDKGPGSLRACVEASGPRTCVFRVAGTITLDTSLKISNPYITIAGQTAPGGGITLRNNPNTNRGTTIWGFTDHVIIRYLRIRSGASINPTCCINAITITKGRNIIIDHVSTSWTVDQTISTWNEYPDINDLEDVTIQWSFITESLHRSTHEKGAHSTAAIFGAADTHDISFHHNLMAHHYARLPRIKVTGLVDIVNNVVYNYGAELSFADTAYDSFSLNYVGNYVKAGPNKATNDNFVKLSVGAGKTIDTYVQGNIEPHRTNDDLAEELCVKSTSRSYLVLIRNPAPPVTTYSCDSMNSCDAYDQVLDGAGATMGLDSQGNYYLRRDAVDKRIIEEVKNGEGRIIDATSLSTMYNPNAIVYLTPADYTKYGINDPIGDDGWPILDPGTPYIDSDHDGMPDDWENLYGFDPNDSSDGPQDADEDGYTNLEEFLNGSKPKDSITTTTTITSSTTTLDNLLPQFFNLRHTPSTVLSGQDVDITVDWKDDKGIRMVIISENSTGVWVNHTVFG